MMTRLRNMSMAFLIILVLAFVGLMVFQWGMDFSGMKGRSTTVGKIDGKKISITQFQKAVQQAYLAEKQKTGKEPDEQRMQQLRDQVWESLIQQILFDREIKKHKLKFTDKELAMYIMNNPPQELQKNPNFLTDGKFDMAKYQAALRNPQINWKPIEDYYRSFLPYQKLQGIVTLAATVTEQEVRDEFMRQNMKARLEYLEAPVAGFSKEKFTFSDAELQKYYEDHKEDFKVEERRKLNYVVFSTQPTARDSARTYRMAEDVLKEARQGADFAKLADENSEDPSVQSNHGDLGYFTKDAMVPAFANAAFSGKPGDIVGPVKTRFGLHIIKIVDRKREKGVLKVRASHILLKFEAGADTKETARYKAKNFKETAEQKDFNFAADEVKAHINQTPDITKGIYIPGFGNLPHVVKWAFKADKDEISEVYRTPRGYAVFQVAEIKPKGYRPFSEVKSIISNRMSLEKRKALARAYLEKFAPEVQQGKSFEAIAKEDTAKILRHNTTAEFALGAVIPGIGISNEIMAAAFKLPLKKVSRIMMTNRGAYFVRPIKRTPFDSSAYASQYQAIRNRLLQQRQQQVFIKWYNHLKENAHIEDNRDLFYRG